MIEVAINGVSYNVPTNLTEIKLSSYIEFVDKHSSFIEKYNKGFYAIALKDGMSAICAVVEGFDAAVSEIEIGEYTKESKRETVNGLLHLINSVIINYAPEPLSDNGYFFTYKDKEWHIPILKMYDGTINPKLKFGQYIEAMETIRVCESVEEKTNSIIFSEYLRLLASLVRERGLTREETLLSLRDGTDNLAVHFEDIDMKTGLDVFFFLNGTITI